jgi:hypothetical protein
MVCHFRHLTDLIVTNVPSITKVVGGSTTVHMLSLMGNITLEDHINQVDLTMMGSTGTHGEDMDIQ